MRAPKIPKRPENPGPDQGELVRFDVVPDGNTEPSQAGHVRVENIEVAPEGVFPDVQPEVSEGAVAANAISAEVAAKAETTAKRSSAQRGKHSPERHGDGSVRLGDVFYHNKKRIIVTERNYDEASVLYRRRWEARQKAQPALGSGALHGVIKEIADKLDMDTAIAAPDAKDVVEPLAQPEPEVELVTNPEPKPEPPPFGSVERILALRDANWAGFLPTTNTEKNDAFKLLQALETDRGVYDFLMSIYYHTRRFEAQRTDPETGELVWNYYEAKQLARQAVVSVIHEMGDKLLGSMAEYDELETLGAIVKETDNPNVTLSELIKDEKTDLRRASAGVVRYIDTNQVYNHELDLPFTPFTDREQRPSARPLSGKNKTVMDPFTAALLLNDDKMEMVRGYVLGRLDEITVKDLRSVIPTLMNEDKVRANYWLLVLSKVKGQYKKFADSIFDELDNQAADNKVQ